MEVTKKMSSSLPFVFPSFFPFSIPFFPFFSLP